jgi:uncharacterized protein YodC (DUF2158 family)
MAKFKVGDIVQLKSGGPVMTVDVARPVGDGIRYRCSWFAGSKLQAGHFPEDTLHAPPAEKKSK